MRARRASNGNSTPGRAASTAPRLARFSPSLLSGLKRKIQAGRSRGGEHDWETKRGPDFSRPFPLTPGTDSLVLRSWRSSMDVRVAANSRVVSPLFKRDDDCSSRPILVKPAVTGASGNGPVQPAVRPGYGDVAFLVRSRARRAGMRPRYWPAAMQAPVSGRPRPIHWSRSWRTRTRAGLTLVAVVLPAALALLCAFPSQRNHEKISRSGSRAALLRATAKRYGYDPLLADDW